MYRSFRKYYQDQLELITSIEGILVQKDDATEDKKGHQRTAKILTNVTLIINIVCSTLFSSFFHSLSFFFFIKDSCHHQNSWCSDLRITFSHFISCR